MKAKSYNIIITGSPLNGASLTSIYSAFSKLFKIGEEKAKQAFANAPFSVKNNVDELTAKKFLMALKKVNIEVKVQLVPDPKTPPLAQNSPQNPAKGSAVDAYAEEEQFTTLESGDSDGYVTGDIYAPDNSNGSEFTIEGRPDSAFLNIRIPKSETVKAEASSITIIDSNIQVSRRVDRSITGKNLTIKEFTADDGPGEIGVSPNAPGDILHQFMTGAALFIKSSAYLASSANIEIEANPDTIKEFSSKSSLAIIKCYGKGDLWFNSYGAAIEIEVNGEYIVDLDKIVAWTDGLEYKPTSIEGYQSLFFPKNGVTCQFSGEGKLWVQTRSDNALSFWAHWFRPVKK